jgi:hypothetical protein
MQSPLRVAFLIKTIALLESEGWRQQGRDATPAERYTVVEALLLCFTAYIGSIEHHETKCLIARMDETISVVYGPHIIFGQYIDLNK